MYIESTNLIVVAFLAVLGLVLGYVVWSKVITKKAIAVTMLVTLCTCSICAVPVVTNFGAAYAVCIFYEVFSGESSGSLDFENCRRCVPGFIAEFEAGPGPRLSESGKIIIDGVADFHFLIRSLVAGMGWFSIGALSSFVLVKQTLEQKTT